MRAERRGRVILACSAVNRDLVGGAGERAEAGGQAVCCFEAAGLGGVAEGEGQSGGCGCRRGVDPGVRGEPDGEPLQALEPALLGELHAAAREGGRDTETQRRVEGARHAHGRRQGRADGRAPVFGAGGGAVFHPDSYGYRPRRSALEAVRVCRERCWRYDWVIDLDLGSFFDSLDHSLVLRAVSHHTSERWILLYVERWLKAPLQHEDGTLEARDRGSPQGSAISPLLANIFLHYALDLWAAREYPAVPFERYADDVILHCKSKQQARVVLDTIARRLAQVGLELNPDKTRIVYCKDQNRTGSHEHERFNFLGYTFRPRMARSRSGGFFVSFCPAVADDAVKEIGRTIKRWRLHLRSGLTLSDLARAINPIVRGWINYYGRFYRSKLISLLRRIDDYLVRWAMKKYKRLRGHPPRARRMLASVQRREPALLAHWQAARPTAG